MMSDERQMWECVNARMCECVNVLIGNGELNELSELGREPVNFWQITRIGARAGLDAPARLMASRNLVDLVDFFFWDLLSGGGVV